MRGAIDYNRLAGSSQSLFETQLLRGAGAPPAARFKQILKHVRCPMPAHLRPLLALLALLIGISAIPTAARPRPSDANYRLLLPLVLERSAPRNPFGFDMRSYLRDEVVPFAISARPKWVRAGDVLWSEVEPVRGGGYRWEAVAEVEANLRRLYAQSGGTIEPALVVQQSPSWAQSIPGRRCSPMKPEYIGDFARFMAALAQRYAEGPLRVRYWEVWNEPDYRPDQVQDSDGTGCWGTADQPELGGAYYGAMLKQVYPAVKLANPDAFVLAGALAYGYGDPAKPGFLSGLLASGAGDFFDALSFHTYGQWDYGDVLVARVLIIRQIMANHGVTDKPLFATEIGVTCANDLAQCRPDFLMRQANYAARIYAETIALDLMGAFWFTLVAPASLPTFNVQLIDERDGQLVPRYAYYAFTNSALLLNDTTYVGAPLTFPSPGDLEKVQSLVFRRKKSSLTPEKGSTLYVLWAPRLDVLSVPHTIPVARGATAVCVQSLYLPTPRRFYCSDEDQNGELSPAVGPFPQYIEVIDP